MLFFNVGYRIRLNNQKPDVASASNAASGRLHVDFAQARDDQYEFECQARRLERELRHRQRIEEDKWRPPSPPPVPHYAEHEAHVVIEQLKVSISEKTLDVFYLVTSTVDFSYRFRMKNDLVERFRF